MEGGEHGCNGGIGCGVVFRLAPGGEETVLHAFEAGTDGFDPAAVLLIDKRGNLYGTTVYGGSSCNLIGCGTVFKVDGNANETVLHEFTGADGDGEFPTSGLIADEAGNLYGTTSGSGINCSGSSTCGTVYELAPGGTETVLYTFTGGSDGADPVAGLIMDAAGNLYGAASAGGTSDCNGLGGCGTIFGIAAEGTESTLYSFAGGKDGATPLGTLIADMAGNLYGTTEHGGGAGCEDGNDCGTIFEFSTGGGEAVIHAFLDKSQGVYPEAGPVLDKKGHLYGTAAERGTGCGFRGFHRTGCGAIFELKN
jgi:uncharacterized repeat protein (TIGR03803 family)